MHFVIIYSNTEFVEGTAISREYNGEEGRYMPPPKHKEKEMEDIEV